VDSLRGTIAITGIGETEQGYLPGRDHWDLLIDASVRAISDAGIDKDQIDGLVTCGSFIEPHAREHLRLADMLGLSRRSFNETSAMGGSSGAASLRLATAIVAAGFATTVLVAASDNLLTASSSDRHAGRTGALARMMSIHDLEFVEPYGNIPATNFALMTRRYMHEFGWTREQLAEVAVALRYHASVTPGAFMTQPITAADVLAAPMVADPFGRLDCSIVTDGGVAYIVTRADRAADGPHDPVYVLGLGATYSSYYTPNFGDVVQYPKQMLRQSADQAFAMAAVSRDDIQVASVPDVFSAAIPIVLEGCGFAEEGGGADLVASGATRLGGRLPVNTHGGNHSYTHPGNPGQMFNVVELIKQLRGKEGVRQVPGAELAFIHSFGGTMAQHCSVVLGRSR
jgi:acetyl-CoA acetyltransferase